MKIVSLTKCWRGHEFLVPMIRSIRDVCQKMVFINSEISWTGEKGNTCKPILSALFDEKIIKLDFEGNQEQQYNYGIDYIENNLECDYVLIIDTDEIFDRHHLRTALDYIEQNPHNAYKTGIRTYIKDIHYQIDPPESLQPTVFVKNGQHHEGVRFSHVPDCVIIPNVYYHHYTAVRNTWHDIERKIIDSNSQDNNKPVDIEKWRIEKWDKLPDSKDLHYSAGYENYWKGIKIIDEIPAVLKNALS